MTQQPPSQPLQESGHPQEQGRAFHAPDAVLREWVLQVKERVAPPPAPVLCGRLLRVVGLTMEAVGLREELGAWCQIIGRQGQRLDAEVIGFSGERTYLMGGGHVQSLRPGAAVRPMGRTFSIGVSDAWLGRVVDGWGQPVDRKGPLLHDSKETTIALENHRHSAMDRLPPAGALDVGVRAINGLLTIARGQRMAILAGTGVGKSVLLGMMARYTAADRVVVALVGERGREVVEFVEQILGEAGMEKAVVVAAPADCPPLERLHAGLLATALAEAFRDQGHDVLLLMDSLTRYAQAQREIGLAIGEPPVTRGYPPSVFSRLPHLVERAGRRQGSQGSITGFYTVLVEGDDFQDPIADATRAVVDGHIVLSRRLAEATHFPAIDVESSVNRVMRDAVDDNQWRAAQAFRRAYALYRQNEDLIMVGAYRRGTNPALDRVVQAFPAMRDYLVQDWHASVSLVESRAALRRVVAMAAGPTAGASNHEQVA